MLLIAQLEPVNRAIVVHIIVVTVVWSYLGGGRGLLGSGVSFPLNE